MHYYNYEEICVHIERYTMHHIIYNIMYVLQDMYAYIYWAICKFIVWFITMYANMYIMWCMHILCDIAFYHRFTKFLGAATGSPYIVFILRFCCMASCYGKIYICRYIYIIHEATVVLLHWNLYRKYRRSIAGGNIYIGGHFLSVRKGRRHGKDFERRPGRRWLCSCLQHCVLRRKRSMLRELLP